MCRIKIRGVKRIYCSCICRRNQGCSGYPKSEAVLFDYRREMDRDGEWWIAYHGVTSFKEQIISDGIRKSSNRCF